LVHAGDWLFLVGATLDATGTWLELLGYLKEPAGLWLLSSVAWLTDSLLYLAADVMNLQQNEDEETATRRQQQQQQEDEEYNNRIVSDNDDDDNVCDTKKAYPPTFPHYHIVHESTKELVEFRSDRRANRADQNNNTANNYQLQEDDDDINNNDETRNVAKVLALVNNNNVIIKTPPLPALMDRTDFDSGSLVTPYVAADDVNLV
jgi:hypothetical protein